MELMFLVYAVENLTYNSGFFMTVSFWLFLLFVIISSVKVFVHFYNENQKELKSIIKHRISLKEGDTFILDENVYQFKKGKTYIVNSVYSHCNSLFYKEVDDNGKEGPLKNIEARSHVESLLSKQKGEQVKTTEAKVITLPKLPSKLLLVIIGLCMSLHTFLPSRQTAIYMAGAYLIQEVATSDAVQDLGKASYNAAVSQLNKWSAEVPELATMVSDAGLESVKKKAVEVISE